MEEESGKMDGSSHPGYQQWHNCRFSERGKEPASRTQPGNGGNGCQHAGDMHSAEVSGGERDVASRHGKPSSEAYIWRPPCIELLGASSWAGSWQAMEKLRSSAASSSHGALQERFLMRLAAASPTLVSLPVIDLSRGRDEVRQAVLHAGKEIGFFQVINHGMPERTMREMEMACRDFFRLPTTDKATLYSEDSGQTNRLFSSTMYRSADGESYSCHCLHLACHPVERTKPAWPEKPAGLRPALEDFIIPARSIAMELLRLLCEGVGLRPDYFEGGLTGGDVIINANHYPPCADPSLTLGLPPHCDWNLITVLLQPGYVCGLQVLYNGDWIDVEPIPGALVINFGHQLEIATNGVLRSMEHRTVANAVVGRTSVAAFIMPTMDCVVGPAKELVGEGRPARYRSVAFRDFMHIYKTVGARKESVEEALQI